MIDLLFRLQQGAVGTDNPNLSATVASSAKERDVVFRKLRVGESPNAAFCARLAVSAGVTRSSCGLREDLYPTRHGCEVGEPSKELHNSAGGWGHGVHNGEARAAPDRAPSTISAEGAAQ